MQHAIKSTFLCCGASLYIALAVTAFSSNAALAQQKIDTQTKLSVADGHVSASEAKRLVRNFLRSRGFTSPHASTSGAGIRAVTGAGIYWQVKVNLISGAKIREAFVWVDSLTGEILEESPKAGLAFAGPNKADKTD